jgi:hypothetical protein
LSEAIASLLDEPVHDAKPWAALLVRAGVPVTLGPDDVPKLQ